MATSQRFIREWIDAIELLANGDAEGFDTDDLTLAAFDATIMGMVTDRLKED